MIIPESDVLPYFTGTRLFSDELMSDALPKRIADGLREAQWRGLRAKLSVTATRGLALGHAYVKPLVITSTTPYISHYPDLDHVRTWKGVPRSIFEATLPFTGTNELWLLRPDSLRKVYVRGNAPVLGDEGAVTLSMSVQVGHEHLVADAFQKEFALLKRVLVAQEEQVNRFNARLRATIEEHVPSRASLARAHDAIRNVTF